MPELTNEDLYKILSGIKKQNFRKKPIVIEAYQYLGCAINIPFIDLRIIQKAEDFIIIETLEGNMKANINDWIIKGIKGEFYPCKPDIFESTYEKVE